jgi:hypothetical protein
MATASKDAASGRAIAPELPLSQEVGPLAHLVLLALALTAGARASLFLAYALLRLDSPVDVWPLESKMVHLAWRVQAGVRFYPGWEDYPHVSNFFGPVYFGVVGLIGRWVGVSLDGLFVVGRSLTLAAGVATSLVIGHEARRRYGVVAGLVGAAASLGAAPMDGFGLMVRPDTLAELLGVLGFFLAVRTGRPERLLGAALLVLAIFTKQTTAVFLVAASAALWWEGHRRAAVGLLGGVGLCVAAIVGIVTATLEPRFAGSLMAEGTSPWSLPNWLERVGRLAHEAPDLILFSVVGPVLWTVPARRDRSLVALSIILVASSFLTAGKYGSDLNYFLSLRVVEGLAVAALVGALLRPPSGRAARGWVVLGLIAATAFLPGDRFARRLVLQARAEDRHFRSAEGQSELAERRSLEARAADPSIRLLTDDGRLQLHQRERAEFGDPWLFRMQVDHGLIHPATMRERIEAGWYDEIVTTRDLFSPEYVPYLFGLPMELVEPARAQYRSAGEQGRHFVYVPAP